MVQPLPRRTMLRGLAGAAVALPALEAMGKVAEAAPANRFCAIYTANGMSLPNPKNGIDQWSWFPKEQGARIQFTNSTEPLAKFADHVTFLSGMHHENGLLADPHMCSDMWLTGAPLHDPAPGTFNSVSLDQVVAQQTKVHCRQPSLVLSIDAGVGFLSRTGTISYNQEGKPIPAESHPRRVFDRMFRSNPADADQERKRLHRRMRLVDSVRESATDLKRQLGASDLRRMDQYLTSIQEVESRLEASERWLDVPLPPQDYSQLNLEATPEGEPADYYRNMFDLIALAFQADITRSVAFMLNREDGMGISDTFPLRLGLSRTHHNLSHAEDPDGQLMFSKYDRFLSEQIAFLMQRLAELKDAQGSVLDRTVVLYGSGCSTTHNPRNLPTLVAGGSQLGLRHGGHWRHDGERMSNFYLRLLQALGIHAETFSDSTGPLSSPLFG
jgi:hypothetical protein